MSNITIYGKHNCNWCVSARELLNRYQIGYEYFTVGEDIGVDEVLNLFPNAKTVPIVTVNGKRIGGYEELREYVEDTRNFDSTGY